MKKLNIALCEGRHNIPQATDGAIYPSIIKDVTDVVSLEKQAEQVLNSFFNGQGTVNLYVTGLTVALVAVINVSIRHGVNLTLWHYNTNTGDYFPQPVA